MQWFENLATKRKLFYSFGLSIFGLLIVIAMASASLSTITNTYQTAIERDSATAIDILELRNSTNRVQCALLTLMLAEDTTIKKGVLKEMDDESEKIQDILPKIQVRYAGDPQLGPQIHELKHTVHEFFLTRDAQVIPLITSHKFEQAKKITFGIQADRFKRMRSLSIQIGDEAQTISRNSQIEAANEAAGLTMASLVIAFLVIAASTAFAALLNKLIATPLEELTKIATAIAAGDISVSDPHSNRTDEVGVLSKAFVSVLHATRDMAQIAERVAGGDLRTQVKPRSDKDVLGRALAKMVANLEETTRQMNGAIDVLTSASADILVSVSESAAGASETATAVAETSATVEEVRQTSEIASQKAKFVSESAHKSAQFTNAGRSATEDNLRGMRRIKDQMELIAGSMVDLSEKNRSIVEIIATVDELAQQCNILAMNASIEAAKAGEQGKGFAVVAREVKDMSQKSQLATAQVRTMLDEIKRATNTAAKATDLGSKIVAVAVQQSSKAGESISQLSGSVEESAEAATQIAACNQQQLAGVDQVVTAMVGIKEATTQNLIAIRHVENAANSLNELGVSLRFLINQYKVSDKVSGS